MNGTATLPGDQARSQATEPAISSRKRALLLGLIVLLYSVSLAVVGSALLRQYGFPLDDSYIHQTVARNLARYHVLGFIPGVPSSGATSVLWTCIQAANYVSIQADPVLFNLVLSWILLSLIGVLLFVLAERDGFSPLYSFAFAATPALCGNFIWFGMIGMEHLLFVALALACIYFWTGAHGTIHALLAGVFAGLLVLARPEAMILALVLAAAGWKAKRSRKDILTMLAIWLPFLIALLVVDLYTSHSPMPTTLKGREWLFFSNSGGPHSLMSILLFPLQWMIIRQQQFSIWQTNPLSTVLCLLASTTLLVVGAAWLIAHSGQRIKLLLLFAVAIVCVYWVQFPTPGHGGRYQPLNVLLLFPCMVFGLCHLMRRLRMNHEKLIRLAVAAILLVAGTASLLMWRTISIDGIEVVNDAKGRTDAWVQHNVPGNARVASFAIGRLSYDWDHRVIDLGALVDPAYVPYLLNHRVPEYLQQQRVNYVIVPSGSLAVDLGLSRAPLTKVAEFCGPNAEWKIGFFYTNHVARCQSIYRMQ